MKIMVAFLGKKKNKRNEYLEQIKSIHKNTAFIEKINKKQEIYLKERGAHFNNEKLNILKKSKNKENNIYNKKINSSVLGKRQEESFFDSLKLTLVFCLILMFIIYKYPNINLNLVKFATNFRQAEEYNVGISDIITTASLFNKDNYILKESETVPSKEEQIEVAKDESSEYQIIDNEAQKYNTQQVIANNNINVNVTSQSATLQKVSINDIHILNYSSNRNIDFKNIISKDVNLTKKSDKILLYNTHTSESYTNSENYKFEYSSVMRTLDARYNMLGIAKELNENLLKKGFISVQDTTPHDYGAYTGAYTKSRQTVTNKLQSMGGAGIIMDVHRDAMADLTYRPVANVNGVQVAQLMFVVGIGTGENKYWEENLKLALKLQQIANRVYPGLFRQMIIRDSTYNQDLNKYSLLVEFGATGNTIEEVKLSTRCLANLLNILYKD